MSILINLTSVYFARSIMTNNWSVSSLLKRKFYQIYVCRYQVFYGRKFLHLV